MPLRNPLKAQSRTLATSALLSMVALSAPSSAEADGEAPGDALVHFAETLVALDALADQRGEGNHHAPLYAPLAGAAKSGKYLCHVHNPPAPRHCKAPGPKPTAEPSAPCAVCDETQKQEHWQSYARAELSVAALQALGSVYADLGYQGNYARLAKALTDHLKAREQVPHVKVLHEHLHRSIGGAAKGARSAGFEELLAQVLSAGELSLTPDDLATEGGLRAAIKLADPNRRNARIRWQTAFAEWAQCRKSALAKGHLPVSTSALAERCNARQPTEARDGLLQWQRRADEQRICLEANKNLNVSVVRHQNVPCQEGRELRGQ